jgi:hypothetical protein
MEIILNIALIISAQIIVYILFLRPKILIWGASDEEVTMPLIGDDLAPKISATRAVSIDAPISEVWKWVIQLGADRGGFFSYALLEKALGYEMQKTKHVSDFQDMEVGRIIPASIDESKSVIKFNFPVAAVDPGKSFVLKNWGAFVLKEISPTQTRLIVRTHGRETSNLLSKFADFVGEALHFIMERRMLIGFKAQAEAGAGMRPSLPADNLWLLGNFLSGIGIALIVFIGKGSLSMILSILYAVVWLWILLILDPRPIFSMILLLIIVITTL